MPSLPADPELRIDLPSAHAPGVPAQLHSYLVAQGLAGPDCAPELSPAGAGNMNSVWRVKLADGRSFILKQARAWVEKYPSIPAPPERAESEACFYRRVASVPVVAGCMPRLLRHDPRSHLLVLEDLAPAEGCDAVYAGRRLSEADLHRLAAWLRALHEIAPTDEARRELANREMRALNHAHIFALPLSEEGPFDAILESITPGLAAEARRLRGDAAYVAAVRRLGEIYLGDAAEPRLLHGDLFPGSLMRTSDGELKVLDPEFAFWGEPGFDRGVFAAHLVLSGHPETLVELWFQLTCPDAAALRTARAFAGVEIMRRLIGIAQLPLSLPLAAKASLLALSRPWVLDSIS